MLQVINSISAKFIKRKLTLEMPLVLKALDKTLLLKRTEETSGSEQNI